MKLYDLLMRALDKRITLVTAEDTDAFRIFNGGGDGYPGLFADIYGSYILIQGYEADVCRTVPSDFAAFEQMCKLLPFTVKGLLFKDREEKANAQNNYSSILLSGELPPENYTVRQNGLFCEVDLVSGLNTGLFLDMREVRQALIPCYGEIDSMQNLFSYTGMFAVHAGSRGVRRTLNVDLAGSVLRKARTNYEKNGLRVDARDFVQEDCGSWLKRAVKKGMSWDMTIFDPPTFSRGREGSFSVKRDYPLFLEMIASCTGSFVLSVINTHSFSTDDYLSFHPKSWKNEWLMHESSDFPAEADPYLKAGLWRLPLG